MFLLFQLAYSGYSKGVEGSADGFFYKRRRDLALPVFWKDEILLCPFMWNDILSWT